MKMTNQNIKIDGYTLSSNIEETDGTGVGIYLNNSLFAREVIFNCNDHSVESMFLKIKLEKKSSLICGVIYRSPSHDNHYAVQELLRTLTAKETFSHLLIMGDFNYPEINWDEQTTNTVETHPTNLFLKKVNDYYLTQHVDQPTRHRQNQIPNCQDLILTPNDSDISRMQFKEPLGISDHLTLEMYFVANAKKLHSHSTNAKRFSYDCGDYDKMRKMLQEVDWEVELQGLDANLMVLFIESKICTTMEECIPQYQINNANKVPLWMNDKIMKIIKEKHDAYNGYTTYVNISIVESNF